MQNADGRDKATKVDQSVTSIPILLLGTEPRAFQCNLAPCVAVVVAKTISDLNGDHPRSREVMAHVDTGADHLYCDITLATELGLQVTGFTEVNGGQPMPIYAAAFEIVGSKWPLTARLVGQDYSRMNVPYRFVLGRIILNLMHLEYAPVHRKRDFRCALTAAALNRPHMGNDMQLY